MSLLNSTSNSNPMHEHFSKSGGELFMAGVGVRDTVVAAAAQRVHQEAFMNNPEQATPAPVETPQYAAPVQTEQQPSSLDFPTTQAATAPGNRSVTSAQFATTEAGLMNSDEMSRQAMIEQALAAAEAARQEQA